MWSEVWMRDAACVDNPNISLEDFFPEDLFTNMQSAEARVHIEKMRSMCGACLVHDECHAWAEERRYPNGFIAGETEGERHSRWSSQRDRERECRPAPVRAGHGGPALP